MAAKTSAELEAVRAALSRCPRYFDTGDTLCPYCDGGEPAPSVVKYMCGRFHHRQIERVKKCQKPK